MKIQIDEYVFTYEFNINSSIDNSDGKTFE
jgi:hypothetical protein